MQKSYTISVVQFAGFLSPPSTPQRSITMTKKKRIEYLICTLIVFISAFIIYGLVASVQPLMNLSKWQSFLAFGSLAGYGFSSIVSAIILSADYFSKRSLAFKIVAAVLWPITFGVCAYAGIFSYIPYQVYNIVKIVKLTRIERQQSDLENEQNTEK